MGALWPGRLFHRFVPVERRDRSIRLLSAANVKSVTRPVDGLPVSGMQRPLLGKPQPILDARHHPERDDRRIRNVLGHGTPRNSSI